MKNKSIFKKKGREGKRNVCGMKMKGEILKMEGFREGGDRMIEVRRGQQKPRIIKMSHK